MSNEGILFNGKNNYCKIPVNVQTATTWKATLVLSTFDSTSGNNNSSTSNVYQQPCIFGVGNISKHCFFVGLYFGKLYIYSWLQGTNNSSQLISGSTLWSNNSYGFGWSTGKNIADGNTHTVVIEASYTTNQLTVTLDNENLGYLNIVNKITANNLLLGVSNSSNNSWTHYARFSLFDFSLEIDGTLAVRYQPSITDALAKTLTDSSGNNNTGVLYGNSYNIGNSLGFIPHLFVTNVSKYESFIPKLLVTTIPFQINLTNTYDTSRTVVKTVTIEADTSREISDGTPIFLTADTKRSLSNNVTIGFDTARTIKAYTHIFASTLRMVLNEDKVQSPIGHNVLTLEPKTKVDSITTFDTVQNFDFNGGIEMSGEYQIPASHRIYNENGTLAYVDMDIDAKAYNINQWLDFAVNFDTIMDFDGENIGAFITVTPYLRLSEDGVTFGDWQRLINGAQYKANYYDFKINLSTIDANTTVVVNKFGYTIHT
jgi:hypothetical protein